MQLGKADVEVACRRSSDKVAYGIMRTFIGANEVLIADGKNVGTSREQPGIYMLGPGSWVIALNQVVQSRSRVPKIAQIVEMRDERCSSIPDYIDRPVRIRGWRLVCFDADRLPFVAHPLQ